MNTGARKTHSRDRSRSIPALTIFAGLAGVLLASTPVAATIVTNTFTVQAVINASCNVTATTLNFGAYDPTSATALNGSSTVSVFCTAGTPYTAALNIGSGGGSFVTRTIANGANTLNYNLFRDSARSQVWGDGSGSTFTVAGTGSGLLTASTLTVYGDIATAQDKPPGTYTSTITVTVTY